MLANQSNNRIMNSKVIIAPEHFLKCDFKHLFTYRFLFHLLAKFNGDNNRITIVKKDIIDKYSSNYHTVNRAIEELIDKDIICRDVYKKDTYILSTKLIRIW